MIINVEPPCDGAWFWYSYFLDSGKRLYADLHMPLQPLFVLETNAFMALLGKGWLLSKIPGVLHLVAYCLALLLLVRQTKLSDVDKAILYTCSFFVSTASGAIVFNDYHLLADCFELYSLLALLALNTSSSVTRTLGLAAILGGLAGLAVTTRPNDGAALFVGVFLAIACLAPSKKLLSLLLFSLTTGFTGLLIVSFTGDSLHDYAINTFFKAAPIKGSFGTLLTQPLRLPLNTAVWLFNVKGFWTLFAVLGALFCALLILPLRRKVGWWQVGLVLAGTDLIIYLAQIVGIFWDNLLVVSLTGFVVLLAYIFGIWVAARFIFSLLNPKRAKSWDKRQILLLVPLGLLASTSMSSGGTFYLAFEPIGVLIVVLAISFPVHLNKLWPRVKARWPYLEAHWGRLEARWRHSTTRWPSLDTHWPRDILVGLAVLATLCAATTRAEAPYRWHTYREKPIFTDRNWYQHPSYGPMYISNELLGMIQQVCPLIRNSGSDNELLSLPFPGGNYFCDIPPWHGYVQTFFDITSIETIQRLLDELQQSPPKWIFYQRQLMTLQLHETVYNQGRPLRQRYLDQLIRDRRLPRECGKLPTLAGAK